MTNLPASEAKNHFGQLLDLAQRDTVTIEKKGRPVAVMMSVEEYSRLEQLEDEIWALKAMQAEKSGYLGEQESEAFLKGLGDSAKD